MSGPQDLIAGRYRLLRRIGSGGMGVVWAARDERLDRPVAVKLLRLPPTLDADEAALASRRALHEARITARLDHPYAVSLFDVVDHDGRPCLVMQLVPSVSLAALLAELRVLSVEEATRLGAEVGSALAAAHRLGIVHGDVKPANVLIADDGSARLSDFGIAKAVDEAAPVPIAGLHGTPAYLAPEVVRGQPVGYATDVYGLGATLYAAVEGTPPFGTDPDPRTLLRRVALGRFTPPAAAGPLTPRLLAMLDPVPEQRPSMAQVLQWLTDPADPDATPSRRLLGRGAAPAAGPAPPPPPQVPEQRTPSGPAQPAGGAGPADPAHPADPAGPAGERQVVLVSPHLAAASTVPAPSRGRAVWAGSAAVLVLVLLAVTVLPALTRGLGSARGGASGPDPATYTSTTFAVPFDVAAPTWLAPEPAVVRPEIVTWQAPDLAVRFLVPVSVHPADGREETAAPPDYLGYLLDQAAYGARFRDQAETEVDGRPAVLVTATADRRLPGVVGCPEAGSRAADCFGLRPERRLRLAVVDVAGTTLLIWLRHDGGDDFDEQSRRFEEMLATVRFR